MAERKTRFRRFGLDFGRFNIYSQRYDRELKDVSAIQADTVLSIVSRMKLTLASNIGEFRTVRRRYPDVLDLQPEYSKP